MLKPSSCVFRILLQENVDYSITVATADLRGNGTDGNVYITLIGEKGESDEQQLYSYDDSGRLFERNTTDKFTLTMTNIGTLQSIRLRMTASWWSSVHSDWYLSEIKVLNTATGLKGSFSYNDWVVKDTILTLGVSSYEDEFNDYQVSVVGLYDSIKNQGYSSRIK